MKHLLYIKKNIHSEKNNIEGKMKTNQEQHRQIGPASVHGNIMRIEHWSSDIL